MVPYRNAGFPQRNHLRMRRRIMVEYVSVEPPPYDLPVTNDYSPHWNFTRVKRPLRRAQRLVHPQFIARRVRCH